MGTGSDRARARRPAGLPGVPPQAAAAAPRRRAASRRGSPVRGRRARPARRPCLGRVDGVPRAAVRCLGVRRRHRRAARRAGPPARHTRVAVVAAARDDVVVRDGHAAAVTTTAGELDADVVVCAVDPRRLPALAARSRVRRRPSPRPRRTSAWPATCATSLMSWSSMATRPLVLRTRGRAPDGHHAWTVQPRAGTTRTPSPRWPGTGSSPRAGGHPGRPLTARPGRAVGRIAARRAVAGSRHRATAARSADADRRRVCRGRHATPGSGLPYVGLSAALVAQVVGPA